MRSGVALQQFGEVSGLGDAGGLAVEEQVEEVGSPDDDRLVLAAQQVNEAGSQVALMGRGAGPTAMSSPSANAPKAKARSAFSAEVGKKGLQ